MIKKEIIVIVLTVLLMCCIVSCTTSNVDSEMNDKKLTIYCSENDGFVIDNVLLFNEKYKNKIEIKLFPTDRRDEYIQAIQGEIAGGGGPDIIIGKRYDAISLSKIIKKEGFYDINQLIKKDKNFKITEYQENIMDWGIVNDKRYLIPIKYSIDAYFSTQEIMDENKIDFDSHIVSIDTLKDYINTFIESIDQDNKEINFLSHLDFLSYIKYTNKISFGFDENIETFKQKDFSGVLNEYKKMHETITPWQEIQHKTYDERSELLKNKEVIFLLKNITSFKELINPYISYQNEINPEIVFCKSTDNKIYSTPEIYAAINSNCVDKAGAYQFIKMLLEKEQQVENKRYYAPGFPVNKEAYTQLKEEFINNAEGIERKGGCTSNDSIEKMVNALEDINPQLYSYDICSNEIRTIMYSDLYEYMQDKVTINDFVESFEKKYIDYLQSEISAAEIIGTAKNKKRQLNLFIMESQQRYMQSSINQFNKNSEDVEFKSEVIRNSKQTNNKEFKNKLTVKLMSGDGPDVIVFREDYFPSLNKIISNGIFTYLDPLISNDLGWDFSLYNKEILKLGVYKGKRYYIPLNSRSDMFGTTMKTLENNNIEFYESNWTWSALSKKVKEFNSKNEGEERYFFSSSFDFRKMIKNCGISFIDDEKKQSNFQSTEFIELMKIYKEIMPAIAPEEIEKIGLEHELLKRGSLVFIDENQLNSPSNVSIINCSYKHFMDEEVKVLPYPKYSNSKKFIMHVGTGLAINKNCIDKQSAYEFIKILLEKSYSQETVSGIPLYKKAYEDKKDKYINNWPPKDEYTKTGICIVNGYHSTGMIDPVSPSKELFDSLDKLLSNMKVSQPLDTAVYDIIDEEMNDFLNDKKTAEETAKNIDEKISIYLNE